MITEHKISSYAFGCDEPPLYRQINSTECECVPVTPLMRFCPQEQRFEVTVRPVDDRVKLIEARLPLPPWRPFMRDDYEPNDDVLRTKTWLVSRVEITDWGALILHARDAANGQEAFIKFDAHDNSYNFCKWYDEAEEKHDYSRLDMCFRLELLKSAHSILDYIDVRVHVSSEFPGVVIKNYTAEHIHTSVVLTIRSKFNQVDLSLKQYLAT